jgi:DnaK suppressor protein
MSQRDEAATMLQTLSYTLSKIDRSLRSMSQGSYGVCVECGEAISLKRLVTIPWASRCICCQELLESRGGSVSRRFARHFTRPV